MIIEQIRKEIMTLNQNFINNVDDYDFWNNHIKFVVQNAVDLADKFKADKEIVELGALLHDVALVSNVGTKADHHINGAKIAENLLKKYNYPERKIKKVVGCVLNHRSGKNATNNEELCVADADILAHFDNIPMCFEVSYKKKNISKPEDLKKYFQKDFDDLSDRTKQTFQERYNTIIDVLFGKLLK